MFLQGENLIATLTTPHCSILISLKLLRNRLNMLNSLKKISFTNKLLEIFCNKLFHFVIYKSNMCTYNSTMQAHYLLAIEN